MVLIQQTSSRDLIGSAVFRSCLMVVSTKGGQQGGITARPVIMSNLCHSCIAATRNTLQSEKKVEIHMHGNGRELRHIHQASRAPQRAADDSDKTEPRGALHTPARPGRGAGHGRLHSTIFITCQSAKTSNGLAAWCVCEVIRGGS